LVLLLLAVGVTCAIGAMDNPVFDGHVYREAPLERSLLARLLLPFVGISLEVTILAGMTTIVFAAYRAVSNRLRRTGIQ